MQEIQISGTETYVENLVSTHVEKLGLTVGSTFGLTQQMLLVYVLQMWQDGADVSAEHCCHCCCVESCASLTLVAFLSL